MENQTFKSEKHDFISFSFGIIFFYFLIAIDLFQPTESFFRTKQTHGLLDSEDVFHPFPRSTRKTGPAATENHSPAINSQIRRLNANNTWEMENETLLQVSKWWRAKSLPSTTTPTANTPNIQSFNSLFMYLKLKRINSHEGFSGVCVKCEYETFFNIFFKKRKKDKLKGAKIGQFVLVVL